MKSLGPRAGSGTLEHKPSRTTGGAQCAEATRESGTGVQSGRQGYSLEGRVIWLGVVSDVAAIYVLDLHRKEAR